MEDFEKNRAEHVLFLETQMQALQAQLAEAKLAEPYLPKVNAVTDVNTSVTTVTVSFGGKHVSLALTAETLQTTPVSDVVSACIDSLYVNLIADAFKPFLRPEIERIAKGVQGSVGAGKW